MPTTQRRFDPPVIDTLQREPYRFGFFQAVRILEHMFLGRGEHGMNARLVPGERIVPRRLRFKNTLALTFPPSEIASLALRNAAGEPIETPDWRAASADQPDTPDQVELTPAFFGMLGAMGALPVVYTEMLLQRELVHRDTAARAFLDIFNHRAAALFYAAWRKYRLPLHHQHEQRRSYLNILLSLSGLDHAAQRDALSRGDGPVYDEVVAGYAAAAQHRPVSAQYLQRVLSDYFRARIRIEQFVGRWYDLPPEQCSRVGVNAVLGRNAQAGARVWQRDLRMRVWIGPLRRAEMSHYFPGKADAEALRKMLALFADVTYEYEVRLILSKEDVGSIALDAAGGSYLGWDSFICTGGANSDRSDASYELPPLH
jgi:type VI secretion system protein ImpH